MRAVDPVAVQALAGEAFPEQRDRALVAMRRDQVRQGDAAHPEHPTVAVGMAHYRFRRDDTVQSTLHGRPHRS